jgi:hypothetical protein
MNRSNYSLIIAGHLTLGAALLHGVSLFFLPDSITFFNGPQWLYELTWAGLVGVCLGIMAFLGILSLYAYSGAGWIRPLPLLRTGLMAIGLLFLLRGLLLAPQLFLWFRIPESARWIHLRFMSFSAISLLMGLLYLKGTRQRNPVSKLGGQPYKYSDE